MCGTDIRRADAEEVPGQGKIPERTMLENFARKVECCSARAGTKHTRTGRSFVWKRFRQGVRGSGKIRLTTLNIRSGRAGGLEAYLRALQQVNVDVGVLQETKLTYGIPAR